MPLLLLLLAWAAGDPVYLVSQKAASSIAYYTPAGQLLATVPTGRHPHEVALSPDRRYLYVTDNGTMRIEDTGAGGNTLSIIDIAARKRVGEISLGEFRRPHGIDVDPATGRLVVSTELPDQLLLVDPAARKVLRRYATGGKTAHMVTLGPGARFAYVSNSNSGDVSAVNLATGEVKRIPTGPRPEGSALSRDGREVYVGNRDGNTVSVIDTATNQVTAQIPIGKGSVRMAAAPDGRHIVCGLYHENAVEIVDVRARKSVAKAPLPHPVVSLTLSRDGSLAFASAEPQDTVFVISIAQRRVVRTIRTAAGAHPDPVIEVGLQ
ncbi:MAG: cytochrome D1 domain-containing protein [Bryobacteraceae bacterium]